MSQNCIVRFVDFGSMPEAGTKYRGEFEDRLGLFTSENRCQS